MLKVATMDRLKELPVREVRNAMKAFDEFAPHDPRDLRRDHLVSEHRAGISCRHEWRTVVDEGGIKFLEKRLEETEYDTAEYCALCGAACLRDAGELFAYDATFKFVDKKPTGGKKEGR